ncbi:hypothetical protein [Limimaricola cinnabarinus]|uniref:hypothetical protein n=1 Tax=Limimaricola cinnabarinus TaxID=1125964 RepID=UPI002FE42BE7
MRAFAFLMPSSPLTLPFAAFSTRRGAMRTPVIGIASTAAFNHVVPGERAGLRRRFVRPISACRNEKPTNAIQVPAPRKPSCRATISCRASALMM